MHGTEPEPWFGLLERLGDAVTVIDSSWHYRYVSAAAAGAIGRPADELVGCYVWDVFPEVVGSPEQEAALQAMKTGEPVNIVWFFDQVGGWFEQRAVPIPGGMIVIVNDVTDRELSRHRAERLVEVGEALARTMNYEQVQAVVTRDVLPLVGASGGSLSVVDRGRGVLRFLGWSGLDPALVADWQEVPLQVPTPSTEAVRSGRPVWEPDPAAAARRFPELSEQLAVIPDGVVAMPLAVGGETIGTLTMTFADLSAVGGPDRAFLSTVAAMCGQALNRAHMFDAGKRTLDELQRHLLPRELPRVAGFELAVRYASAETGVDIGGDWYDVVALPSGVVTLVLGDVEGHDLAAAALMGLVRSALRAYLSEGHPPAAAVARTNVFLHGLRVERLVTVALLQLQAEERGVVAVSAGHPVALVASPEGEVFDIPTEVGPPLGVHPDGTHWPESTSTLPEAATVLLYTDGLVEERSASISDGIDRVRAALRVGVRLGVDQLLERLLALRVGVFTDDVALLVCRLVSSAPSTRVR